jgi:invasion protein IalB
MLRGVLGLAGFGLVVFGLIVFVLAFGGMSSAVAPTSAAGAKPPTAMAGDSFGDWVYECQAAKDGKGGCALSQTLVSGDTRKPVVKFNLGRDPQTAIIYLAALLPLGLDLPDGVYGAVDNQRQFSYSVETCLPLGCVARIEADAALISAIKRGKQLKISFRFRGASQATTLPGSLSGIAAGLAAAALE